MGTCPFTNSGGPGGKAGPCSTKSCAIYMKSQEICSFLAMGMAIWQTTFGPKADPTLGDHEPLWAAEKEIEDLQAALEAAKQINAAARIEELQAAMEEKKPGQKWSYSSKDGAIDGIKKATLKLGRKGDAKLVLKTVKLSLDNADATEHFIHSKLSAGAFEAEHMRVWQTKGTSLKPEN